MTKTHRSKAELRFLSKDITIVSPLELDVVSLCPLEVYYL